MITAACAVVNGGYLVQPHVVQQILDADGNILENMEPAVKRQVISAETSATMRELLARIKTNMLFVSCKMNDINYSTFINGLNKAGIQMNRKMLADLAVNDAAGFTTLVKSAKKALEK